VSQILRDRTALEIQGIGLRLGRDRWLSLLRSHFAYVFLRLRQEGQQEAVQELREVLRKHHPAKDLEGLDKALNELEEKHERPEACPHYSPWHG